MNSFLNRRIKQKGGTVIAFCKDSGKNLDTQTVAQKSINLFSFVPKRLSRCGSGLHGFCMYTNCCADEENMRSQKHPKQRGFTLIELMIVVVIIAILAAMAIPRFMRASVKSKQSEARLILKQIYTMERAYRQEKDTYYPGDGSTIVAQPGEVIAPLGVEIMPAVYYSYSITGDATTFSATAGSKSATGLDGDPTLDVWTIDRTGNLTFTTDDSED